MQLFRRLLLSYFPDSLVKDSFNPASMFISFISAKDFFTIIDRKIIENYKLNLFDLSVDIFEGKLGLGVHKDMMQSKMTDSYYSYIAAANFNGYKFYNVGNTASAMTLLCSLYLYEAFDKGEESVFVDALYTFYLLTFLFAARIKVFPGVDEKSDFQWFVDLYFNFFEIVTSQLKHKISKENIQKLRTKMLVHIDIFFMMFYYERRVNGLYIDSDKLRRNYYNEFYQWLFGSQPSIIQKNFLQNREKIITDSKFSEIEENLLFEIAPADIHLKYLFLETDVSDVISGLGKGITAASIGRILKSAGYKVTMGKMDPYLQIDAGTMSPFEHGETFVTTDGFETDLDLGHYERFIDEELTKYSSTTTGQIYLSVINKERKGEYLGKTVQVIPHIINEVKDRIRKIAEGSDVAIIEIGGTVGDIEGPHFIETMRQARHELGRDNVLFVHVAPIVTVTTSGEMKTKAIQHSIIKLRELGIQADILICRTPNPLEDGLKKKLSMFCDLEEDYIIENLDQNIYELPLSFQKQGLDKLIIKRLFNEDKASDLTQWENLVNKLKNPESEITIGIAGKYTHLDDSYISVVEALKHAGAHYSTKVNIERIDTEKFESEGRENEFANLCNSKNISGIVVPGGFGNRGIQGMINIATFCMDKNIPYLGLCLGMQIATIAFTRSVCNIPQANSGEFTPENEFNVIDIMEEQKSITDKGGTMRLGSYDAVLKENTKTWELYKEFNQIDISSNVVKERHRHRYEVNPKFHEILSKSGLAFSGLSPNGELVEFIELPKLKYFVATQAHPEFKSRLNRPHPLFAGLVKSILK